MDQLFNLLKERGNNTMEMIINLFKEAKMMDKAEMEAKIRELLKDVPNPQNVSLEKFQEVMTRFAHEHEKTIEEVTDMLTVAGTELMQLADVVEPTLTFAHESQASSSKKPPS